MIQPENPPDAVDEFIELLNLDPNKKFVLEQNDPGMYTYKLTFENII